MKESNLRINEHCVQCGSCLGLGYSFLDSESDGTISVVLGTMLEENSEEFRNLREVCPCNAFELDNIVDDSFIVKELLSKLKEFTGVKLPTAEDVRFTASEYEVPIPYANREGKYEHSSDSAAEKAALNEFERAMYSQIDTIILRIVTEYRVKKVKPYYSEQIEDGSVYAESNEYVSDLLKGIKRILGDKLPSDFAEINIFPDDRSYIRMFERGEVVGEELVRYAKAEFNYKSSEYSCFWTTDDMEVCVGKDRKGYSKFKEQYCFDNMDKAFKELAKDIKQACSFAKSDFERIAISKVESLVNKYNKELEKVLKEKVQMVENILFSECTNGVFCDREKDSKEEKTERRNVEINLEQILVVNRYDTKELELGETDCSDTDEVAKDIVEAVYESNAVFDLTCNTGGYSLEEGLFIWEKGKFLKKKRVFDNELFIEILGITHLGIACKTIKRGSVPIHRYWWVDLHSGEPKEFIFNRIRKFIASEKYILTLTIVDYWFEHKVDVYDKEFNFIDTIHSNIEGQDFFFEHNNEIFILSTPKGCNNPARYELLLFNEESICADHICYFDNICLDENWVYYVVQELLNKRIYHKFYRVDLLSGKKECIYEKGYSSFFHEVCINQQHGICRKGGTMYIEEDRLYYEYGDKNMGYGKTDSFQVL